MDILLRDAATFQAHELNFTGKPIPNWGSTNDLRIEAWRRTDGAVSSISQRYPFTHHDEPLGGEGIFARQPIEPGKWYFEHVENAVVQRFDHLESGCRHADQTSSMGCTREAVSDAECEIPGMITSGSEARLRQQVGLHPWRSSTSVNKRAIGALTQTR
jgi:hypothetical protein